MSIHTLTRKQVLASPVEPVFDFFRAPENLALITPRWLDFKILTPLPLEMKEGTVIDYTIRWLGFPVRWKTLITDYQPPLRFVDQQIQGPYSFWHHTHTFVQKGENTEMTDEVRYALPFPVIGEMLHMLIVQQQLQVIFDYRARAIAEIFPSGADRHITANYQGIIP